MPADVIVIGGGNAALCAAIAAREAGASVTVLEAAPRHMRGGNSRHTRNLRVMHREPRAPLVESYDTGEYLDDLLRVTGGQTDRDLARLVIESTGEAFAFLARNGVRFQDALSGTLNLARTNAFFLGGGKALINALYARAGALGITVHYEAAVEHLAIRDGRVAEVHWRQDEATNVSQPAAVVAASGGFQANLGWLAEAWGEAAANFAIRGTPYATGTVLCDLLDQGVASVGDATQCHAVAVDARAPQFDGGIVTRLDAIPYSITVNRYGERFYDEGQDIWPKRYAIWGRLIAQQPGQVAYAICDTPATRLFMPSCYPPVMAGTIAELAAALGLPEARLEETVASYNRACPSNGFDPSRLDGCATAGIAPLKSNWARPIVDPPFVAYPLRPGITFTYLGVQVDAAARVQASDGTAIANLFAAGEIMAGSILAQGYLAGFGMAIGGVFGMIAGREAAGHGAA